MGSATPESFLHPGFSRTVPLSRRSPALPLKITLPENLKADVPQTKWGKLLSATPVILTVVATMLAGLASSEMTRAQYNRSLAAQRQSKAGDQWSFFQAKKLRSAVQTSTLDMVASTADVNPIDEAALRQALATGSSAAALDAAALAVLAGGELPTANTTPDLSPEVRKALAALDASRPDDEIDALLVPIDDAALDAAVREVRSHALDLDAANKPVADAIGELEKRLLRSSRDASLRRNFTAARLRYHARRYDAEARLNQTIGSLYELQVRKSNIAAARHHQRSQKFFYGMLAAQMGVIVSTLAIAARRRNLLWSLAAVAGVAAIAFALYVYLYV